MENCIFCKIIAGEIPSDILYQDEKVIAFKDIKPVAPVHVLLVPKEHIENIYELNDSNAHVLLDIHRVMRKIVKDMGLEDKGFRLITNCGSDAGQTVPHLHFHLIGGKNLGMSII